MDRKVCFYKIEQLLNEYRTVSMVILIDGLRVSRVTDNHDIKYMRNHPNGPITGATGGAG